MADAQSLPPWTAGLSEIQRGVWMGPPSWSHLVVGLHTVFITFWQLVLGTFEKKIKFTIILLGIIMLLLFNLKAPLCRKFLGLFRTPDV